MSGNDKKRCIFCGVCTYKCARTTGHTRDGARFHVKCFHRIHDRRRLLLPAEKRLDRRGFKFFSHTLIDAHEWYESASARAARFAPRFRIHPASGMVFAPGAANGVGMK
ncbi:MAG TPA: hypothetical protein VFC78_24270 [Tepidisphaeraceae bacterium]|nr:hypothetical protein [Tepidisphaeraceae bacterium]